MGHFYRPRHFTIEGEFMNDWNHWLQIDFLGNTVAAYLSAFIIGLISLVLLHAAARIVCSHFRRMSGGTGTAAVYAGFMLTMIKRIVFPLLSPGAFYLALIQLKLNPGFFRVLNIAAVAILTIQATRLILAVSIFVLEQTWLKQQTDKGGTPVSRSILTILQLIVWGLAIVFMFDNLGFNVSAIVAGLGITGVAVALAAQTILGDLFNYFVIFFDRPFEEGDFIIFDDYMGVIENIGIKSTRIRALDGEQIVISNSNLTAAKIRNFKRMEKRRAQFKIGVTYETPNDKLQKIPAIVRAAIEAQPKTRFDHANFKEFAESSLNYEVVYYILNADYNFYAETQEKINLAVKDAFEKEKIEFAYPTQVQFQRRID